MHASRGTRVGWDGWEIFFGGRGGIFYLGGAAGGGGGEGWGGRLGVRIAGRLNRNGRKYMTHNCLLTPSILLHMLVHQLTGKKH